MLLSLDQLIIPDYQRPYKWTEKNFGIKMDINHTSSFENGHSGLVYPDPKTKIYKIWINSFIKLNLAVGKPGKFKSEKQMGEFGEEGERRKKKEKRERLVAKDAKKPSKHKHAKGSKHYRFNVIAYIWTVSFFVLIKVQIFRHDKQLSTKQPCLNPFASFARFPSRPLR